MGNRKNKASRKNKGQAVVEFALTIPIVLLLVLGIIEGGWLMSTYTLITSAGREAARYGAGIGSSSAGMPFYNDCDGIKAAALRIGTFAGIQPADIHIFHDTGPDTTQTEYCTVATPSVPFGTDDRIIITVDKTYIPISPLVIIPSIPLRSVNAHTILMGANVVAESQVIPNTGQLCDVSDYSVTYEANPSGPNVQGKINNGTGVPQPIKSVLIVWNTSGGPVLASVTGIPGIPSPINSVGPTYTSSVHWTLNPGLTYFTINFTKALHSNVIMRITLDDEQQCAFGK